MVEQVVHRRPVAFDHCHKSFLDHDQCGDYLADPLTSEILKITSFIDFGRRGPAHPAPSHGDNRCSRPKRGLGAVVDDLGRRQDLLCGRLHAFDGDAKFTSGARHSPVIAVVDEYRKLTHVAGDRRMMAANSCAGIVPASERGCHVAGAIWLALIGLSGDTRVAVARPSAQYEKLYAARLKPPRIPAVVLTEAALTLRCESVETARLPCRTCLTAIYQSVCVWLFTPWRPVKLQGVAMWRSIPLARWRVCCLTSHRHSRCRSRLRTVRDAVHGGCGCATNAAQDGWRVHRIPVRRLAQQPQRQSQQWYGAPPQQDYYREQDGQGIYANSSPPDRMHEQQRAGDRMDPRFLRQEVAYNGKEAPGTIVIDTPSHFLYLVEARR